ncbi:hypothetical protein SARC_05975 [Sphaeroforma arctica JP610]|uniref:CDP-alcohol phosphatidyltransferase n=1 Tax=Sphaeroforma arctica JP610 TaxID=667725 RepID=A0A0L0G0I0_9EUKA|nr:hypothetical protein SARC_05975 [Sphaeroforma arctica JP610]KNC81718.1 hypothetical protein SARC_05975 [Sphaeroforma arctica JP610]|eukprot:XP_014155620.1 hypothetical protein SARC_05975 [Sphaeroforma arctica JP610]
MSAKTHASSGKTTKINDTINGENAGRRRSSAILRDDMVNILMFIPNLIGYARILLLVLMFYFHELDRKWLVVVTYLVFSVLDIVDGAAARHLDQRSQFGAFMDVVLDNFGRSFLWAGYNPIAGAVFGSVEWMTFSLIQVAAKQGMSDWKTKHFEEAPAFFRYLMSNNLKNPLGTWCMAGQFLLPLQLYAGRYGLEVPFNQAVLIIMIMGRALGLAIEAFVVYGAVKNMLSEDATVNRLKSKGSST